MTELLEQAIEAVRRLPDEAQDIIARVLIDVCYGEVVDLEQLDPETRAAIEEGLAQAERGEFVSDEEMAAFFARHRD